MAKILIDVQGYNIQLATSQPLTISQIIQILKNQQYIRPKYLPLDFIKCWNNQGILFDNNQMIQFLSQQQHIKIKYIQTYDNVRVVPKSIKRSVQKQAILQSNSNKQISSLNNNKNSYNSNDSQQSRSIIQDLKLKNESLIKQLDKQRKQRIRVFDQFQKCRIALQKSNVPYKVQGRNMHSLEKQTKIQPFKNQQKPNHNSPIDKKPLGNKKSSNHETQNLSQAQIKLLKYRQLVSKNQQKGNEQAIKNNYIIEPSQQAVQKLVQSDKKLCNVKSYTVVSNSRNPINHQNKLTFTQYENKSNNLSNLTGNIYSASQGQYKYQNNKLIISNNQKLSSTSNNHQPQLSINSPSTNGYNKVSSIRQSEYGRSSIPEQGQAKKAISSMNLGVRGMSKK